MTIPTETGGDHARSAFYTAKQDALRFLAYRMRSQAEVRRRLEKRHSSQVIDRVIAELLEQRYLDDAAFAVEWRQHRERRRPRGQVLIRHELMQLGVDLEVIREALADFDAPDNAYRAGRGLAGRLADSDYPQFRQRVWSHLQRRGFDHTVIRDAVDRLWQELADPLHSGVDTEQDED